MGWLTGWSYRKSHIINPVSGAGQNYQKKIVVHFGTGTDSGEDVYLNSKCKIDFGDVRFTDDNGVTLLKYWIEKKIDSDYAVMWVKVNDDLGTYSVKIYIYYGANEVADSNGNATFIFFDDFETDLSKWSIVKQASISTDYAYSGTKCVKIEVINDITGFISKTALGSDIAIHAHYYDIMSVEKECHYLMTYVFDEAVTIGPMEDDSRYDYAIEPTYYDSGIDRVVDWHEFVVRCTTGLKECLIDDVLMPNTSVLNGVSLFILTSANGGTLFPGAIGKSYWDAVFVRKFVSPEPSHGTWGIEEFGEPGHPVYEVEDVIGISLLNPLLMDDVVFSLPKIKTLIVEDSIFSLLFSSHAIMFLSEDVLSSLVRIKTLEAEDVVSSLVRIKTLTVEDIVYLSSLSFHVPVSSEDVTNLLPLSFHVPVSSEDIVFSLSAQRLREVLIEFGVVGITDVAYM